MNTNQDNSRTILLVDDDQALLDSLVRVHRKSYSFLTACGGEEGLEVLESAEQVAVVVSDYQMPGMNGITFLSKARVSTPDTVRVMLTGNADLNSAIEAVNHGNIFRFLLKPCEPEVFSACMETALEQYRLQKAEQFLLEQTLRGSIEVLADVLSLSNPEAFGRSTRVRYYVDKIVANLGLESPWLYETAALLSQIGCVAIPQNILERIAAGETISEQYEEVMNRHPETARDLLGKIPRLEKVAEIIAHQRRPFRAKDGAQLDPVVRMGSAVLAAALGFDERIALGATREDAVRDMAKEVGFYEPRLLQILAHVTLPGKRMVSRSLHVQDLRVGMILAQDVLNSEGAMIVTKDSQITQSMLARLRNYSHVGGVSGPIRVDVPSGNADDKSQAA